MQQIHSLPQPRAAGYTWEDLEEARAVYNRVRQKAREIESERYRLEAEIRSHIDRDTRDLGRAWLAGEDGESEDPQIRELQERTRELERKEMALRNVAIPEAEAQVAQVIGQNRLVWQEQLWEDLPERVAEARASLGEAAAIIQAAMHRVTVTLSLIDWTNSPNPLAYSPPSVADRATAEAFRNLYEMVSKIEGRLEERNAEREVEEVEA